jgi:hypothetical protein
VLIFLSFGLPGAGILAWVVMRADNTRGEQLAGTHLQATGADDRRSENKRRARGLDDRREAARLDDFLALLAEHPTTGVRNAGVASVGPVQPRADIPVGAVPARLSKEQSVPYRAGADRQAATEPRCIEGREAERAKVHLIALLNR